MAGDDRTITAHFIADTSGFEEGAQQVENSSKAIETSTTGLGKSYEEMAKQLEATGKSASGTFTLMDDGLQKTIVYTDDFQKQFSGASKDWDNVTSSVANFGTASEESSKASAALGSTIAISNEEADKAVAEFLGLSNATEKTTKTTKEAEGGFRDFMRGLQEVQQIIQLVQMVAQVIAALDKMNQALKDSQTAFTYLTGSADEANKALTKLNTSAAAMAFGSKAVDDTAQHMLMLGKNADEVQQVISKVADGLAAMGKDGSQLDSVVTQLEKMKTETRVTKDEIDNLVNQGLPAWDALAQAMGTDIETAQRRVLAGAVTGSQAFNDIMKGLDQYAGAADEKTVTLSAEWTRFSQNIAGLLKPFIDSLTRVLDIINNILEGTLSMNYALSPGLVSFGQTFGNLGSGLVAGHASGIIDSPVGHFATVGEQGPETMFIPAGASIFPYGSNPLDALAGGVDSSLSSSALSAIDLVGAMEEAFSRALANMADRPVTIQMDAYAVASATVPHLAPVMRQNFGVRR